MRKSLLLLLLVLSPLCLKAQQEAPMRYVDGESLTLTGRWGAGKPNTYHRLDAAELTNLPENVKGLATNAAGLQLVFQTNSRSIEVKWTLEKYVSLWNMTPLAINGLDLYGWNGSNWQYVSSAKPSGISNSDTFIRNLDGSMRHYKVYLPLYAAVKHIEIGLEEKARIKAADKEYLPSQKVVIYGSSITQGASASRPGMAYPAIVSRDLNVETFNLGFSGAGKMEIEMADVLGRTPADLYVLDCVPNPSPEEITSRAVPFIKRLRQLQPDVPILLVESIFRENGHWDVKIKESVTRQNAAFQLAYQQLIKEGYKQLHYIPSSELTGHDHDATADGVHLSDLGQAKVAERVKQSISHILQVR
jgi:hypothetical protein